MLGDVTSNNIILRCRVSIAGATLGITMINQWLNLCMLVRRSGITEQALGE